MKINIVIGHTDFRGRCLLETLYTQHNVKYEIIFGQHIVMSEPYVLYIFFVYDYFSTSCLLLCDYVRNCRLIVLCICAYYVNVPQYHKCMICI